MFPFVIFQWHLLLMFSPLFFKTSRMTHLTIFRTVMQFKDTFFCCFLQMWHIHSAIFMCSCMNYSETLYNNEASDAFMFLLQVLFKWILIIYQLQLGFSEESPLSWWLKSLPLFFFQEWTSQTEAAHKFILDILLLDPHWHQTCLSQVAVQLFVLFYVFSWTLLNLFVSCEPEPFCFRGCRWKRGCCQTAASSRRCLGSWTKLTVCGRLL